MCHNTLHVARACIQHTPCRKVHTGIKAAVLWGMHPYGYVRRHEASSGVLPCACEHASRHAEAQGVALLAVRCPHAPIGLSASPQDLTHTRPCAGLMGLPQGMTDWARIPRATGTSHAPACCSEPHTLPLSLYTQRGRCSAGLCPCAARSEQHVRPLTGRSSALLWRQAALLLHRLHTAHRANPSDSLQCTCQAMHARVKAKQAGNHGTGPGTSACREGMRDAGKPKAHTHTHTHTRTRIHAHTHARMRFARAARPMSACGTRPRHASQAVGASKACRRA